MSLTLVIANKCYSSWSFRPWILMRHLGIPFEEVVVPLAEPSTRDALLTHTPSAKAPCLHDGGITVWDSSAIIEYLAESFPEHAVWPKDRLARATARSLAAEMHAGFMELRALLPMNMRRKVQRLELTEGAVADIARLEQAFAQAREHFGRGGDFLFGDFCAADAMFAPVVNRLHVYDVPVTPTTRTYMGRMMALPAWQEWSAQAAVEPWTIAKYEKVPV
jgi:glutathione S-transferase